MKKVSLLVFSIIVLLLGINTINAALVEGDDVYHFDFTMDQKQLTNYYDGLAIKCLLNYGRDNNDGYTEVFERAAYTGEAFSTLFYGTTDLYIWNYDRGTVDKHNATGANNFVADVSHLDEWSCSLAHFGYNKIAVYFESEDEIPVRTDYTIDYTNKTVADLNDYEYSILLMLFYLEGDDILPDVYNDNDIDNLPVYLTNKGKQILKFDLDSNDDLVVTIPNPDELTTDDNVVLTKEFLQNATLTQNSSSLSNFREELVFYFDTVNVIVSHNTPQEETPPVNPVTPQPEPEENNVDWGNPIVIDEGTVGYVYPDEDVTEPNPQSEDSVLLYMILGPIAFYGIYLCLNNIKLKNN